MPTAGYSAVVIYCELELWDRLRDINQGEGYISPWWDKDGIGYMQYFYSKTFNSLITEIFYYPIENKYLSNNSSSLLI